VAWTQDREQTTPEIHFPPVGAQGRSILAEGDGSVTATDTMTGQVLWRLRLEGPIVASPVLAGPVVLVADAGKHLWALDAGTGTARWVASFPDLVGAAPAVGDGVVVVPGEDRVVRALRLDDGHELWNETSSELIDSPPAIAGHDVVIADAGGTLTERTLRTGHTVWSKSLDGGLAAGPAVAGDLVVAESDTGTVFGYDVRTGDERWTAAPGSNLYEPPAIAGGLVVVIEYNTDRVTAFDAKDGHTVWRSPFPGDAVGGPLVVGNEVLVLTGTSNVYRFDLRTGASRGTVVPTPSGPGQTYQSSLPLTAFGGTVVMVARTQAQWPETHLVAFPATAGRAADGVRFSGEVRVLPSNPKTPPRLAGGDIVYAGTDGAVWSVPPSGPPRAVLRSSALGPFAIPDGSNLLVQDGAHLEAIRRSGGAPLWRADMPAASAGSVPTISAGSLFVPLAKLGMDAVSASTGRTVWPPTSVTDVGASSTPLVLPGGDVAYAPGALVRLNGRTGATMWTLAGIAVFAPMAYDGGRIFADDLTSGLTAVDATTGRTIWSAPLKIAALVGPAAGDGVVVSVDAAGTVRAFDQATGAVRWTSQLRTAPSGTPVIIGRHVVFAQKGRPEDNYQRDRELVVLDVRTGAFEGSFETGGTDVGFGGVSFGASGDQLILPATTTSPSAAFLLRLEATP
jgi:outer membrane protein assembly factor BamB